MLDGSYSEARGSLPFRCKKLHSSDCEQVWTMFARSQQQLSSPLILPMFASIVSVSVIASVLMLPPPTAILRLQQLIWKGALDIIIAACLPAATVFSIWRLVRDYVKPTISTLAVQIWAVVL